MAFTSSSYTQTVNVLTQTGADGFWFASTDPSGNLYKVGYLESGKVEGITALFGYNYFRDVLTAMITNSIPLPSVEVNINAERVADKVGLLDQFEDQTAQNPNGITDAELQIIANNYNTEDFCKFVGVFTLVRRFYLLGLLTLGQLSNVFIYLGQQRKITRERVETSTQWLLDNSHITQTQYDNFWLTWESQVGI